jgi:pyruvate,orthophosphate dikinase
VRRLAVRANADTPDDARRALRFGAEGIGLCRTEHMFFGEDRDHLVSDAFLSAERLRRASQGPAEDPGRAALEADFGTALAALEALQRDDFEDILRTMEGRPVTIRLLDPPLHEFLPVDSFRRELAELEAAGGGSSELAAARERLELADQLSEANPMLGTRGGRLGILYPPLYEMQARAVVEAAIAVQRAGTAVRLEIMLPLIAYEGELAELRELVEAAARAACEAAGEELSYSIGTMVELPRACLVADRIATRADFFSFGTNDLTQTAIGLSRDDVERRFLEQYVLDGILDRSPFETLDRPGVGELVRTAVERGRGANPELKLGICGEHGGDPTSIEFFEAVGLDYVSCSPARIPVARLAAAQATLSATR